MKMYPEKTRYQLEKQISELETKLKLYKFNKGFLITMVLMNLILLNILVGYLTQ